MEFLDLSQLKKNQKMKKLQLLFLAFFTSISFAQIQTPDASPYSKIEQKVGLTEFTISYSRPSKRNRIIMGDLVPYGDIWRAGANANTTVTFNDPIMIEGQALAAGKYAIFVKPQPKEWEVYFYTKTNNNGLPQKWDPESVALTVKAKVTYLQETIESFTIVLEDLNAKGATLNFKWENTKASLDVKVPTDEKAMESIVKTIKGSPSARDFYLAAIYFKDTGRDLKQAKKWIAKAISMDADKYWMYRQQSLILNGLGETSKAVEAAKISLELAKKAGNQDYVRLNTKAIKEWSK